MKLVRMATPGMVRRMRSISFRKISPEPPRFMRLQHARARVLQRHVDVLHQRGVRGHGIEQPLRDLVRIGVEEADPLLARGFDLAPAARANAPGRPSRPRSSP